MYAAVSNSEFKNNHGQPRTNVDKYTLKPEVRHNPLQRIMLCPYGLWLNSEFLDVPCKDLQKRDNYCIFMHNERTAGSSQGGP
jgi:hypothetical protein